jgi:hypothetical protein
VWAALGDDDVVWQKKMDRMRTAKTAGIKVDLGSVWAALGDDDVVWANTFQRIRDASKNHYIGDQTWSLARRLDEALWQKCTAGGRMMMRDWKKLAIQIKPRQGQELPAPPVKRVRLL